MSTRSKRQIARRVAIEIRAAELCLDAPRGPLGQDNGYSPREYAGWGMHYWYEHRRDASKRERQALHDAAPTSDEEAAGWLARDMYKAGCRDEPPSWFRWQP